MKKLITIHPAFLSLEPELSRIPENFDSQGELLYRGRNTIKLFDMDYHILNVKRYKRPSFCNRIIYTFFRKTKAERAYLNSEEIVRRGFNSPQPVAWLAVRKGGLITDAFYISSHEDEYNRNMYEFGQGGTEGREHILTAFARYTAALHEAGIFHHDYSPGNILFSLHNGRAEFCLVDTNRMSFGDVSIARGCSAFAALWGSADIFEFIADRYADARKTSARLCRRLISRRRKIFWRRYASKHGMPY
ncbi:MAG: lipopolysaccharide kinase InaA family protein [Tannerellaceae bacterium]|jgi:tRNA A-37 threonylcarbamoyl transferase component Bud32|nr:lipopolysaccharide kinase InaA family protein [Tannerellaceae bacterium]